MAATYSVSTAFKAIDKISAVFNSMGNAANRFRKAGKNSFSAVNRGASNFKSITGGIISASLIQKGFSLAGRGIKSFITEASKIEDATAAFTPLLGGAKKARELVDKLNQTAATTPFQFEAIAGVAKQLLPVMNGNLEEVVSTFRRLGDTAGGNAQKLDSIARGFTKAMLKGKVDLESLNIIGEAGVPIFTELADSMGTKVGPAFFKMISAGKVSTKELTKVFRKMTSEGGIFFKGMEIASETVSGKFSTLRDVIGITVGSIGLQLFPVIKNITDAMIEASLKVRDWVIANKELINLKIADFVTGVKKAFKAMLPFLKVAWQITSFLLPIIVKLAPAFIAWRLATLLATAALAVQVKFLVIAKFLQFVKIIFMIVKAKGIWAAAQWALNLAMAANPIGLIAAGIIALIAVIALVVIHWDDMTFAVKKANFQLNLFFANLIKKSAVLTKFGGVVTKMFQAVGLAPKKLDSAGLDKLTGLTKEQRVRIVRGEDEPEEESKIDKLKKEFGVNFEAPNAAFEKSRNQISGSAKITVAAEKDTTIKSIKNGITGVAIPELGPN